MGGVGIRDSKKYIVTSGLTLHLDNTSTSYSGLTGITWSDVSGMNRAFRARSDFVGTANPNFAIDPSGYYGFRFNGFSNTFAGAYWFTEATTAIDFNRSYTLEFLCKPEDGGRIESACGGGFGGGCTLFSKAGSGANNSSQWVFKSLRISCSNGTPYCNPFCGTPPGTSDLLRFDFVACGTFSNVQSFEVAAGTFFNQQYGTKTFLPQYFSYVFNKTSASTYTLTSYINGRLWGSASSTFVNAPLGDLRIGGKDNNCDQNAWRGWIYNVRMYDRVLTADEIKQNFEAIRGKAGL
jgi:hypothetical protein